MRSIFRKISGKKLPIGEPDAARWGNPPNDPTNPTWTAKNWLTARYHFEFARYKNPLNQRFGVLKVMNDDLLQPSRGFETHPHKDMEIATYVVSGHLSHKDSMGSWETLQAGSVQYMSAGTGVTHSETNMHESLPCRMIQMWVPPRTLDLEPNYGSASSPAEGRRNRFFHLVGDCEDVGCNAPLIRIYQDVNMYVADISPGEIAAFELKTDRQAYTLCMEGNVIEVSRDGASTPIETLMMYDGAEAHGGCSLQFRPVGEAEGKVLLVEMAEDGSGRGDL